MPLACSSPPLLPTPLPLPPPSPPTPLPLLLPSAPTPPLSLPPSRPTPPHSHSFFRGIPPHPHYHLLPPPILVPDAPHLLPPNLNLTTAPPTSPPPLPPSRALDDPSLLAKHPHTHQHYHTPHPPHQPPLPPITITITTMLTSFISLSFPFTLPLFFHFNFFFAATFGKVAPNPWDLLLTLSIIKVAKIQYHYSGYYHKHTNKLFSRYNFIQKKISCRRSDQWVCR